MDIIKEIEKELNKIKQGEFANLDNIKLTSDLGKKVIENVVKSLLPVVSIELPSVDSSEFSEWLKSEGYVNTLNEHFIRKDSIEYKKNIVYNHYCNVIQFGN